ncbi:cell division protein FtsZ [bacterium]|nr:cell division protein FtsZ [bacterium]MBL7052860.1 cell division protein FtsZ [Candidatus Neomarinimicrobiota bacterium]
MLFEIDSFSHLRAKMKVIGVGGAGGNAINRMIESGLSGVDFVAINTDAQALDANQAQTKLAIGHTGLGAGANTETGRQAAEDHRDDIRQILQETDMVFITAGMGGGTGTGASPIIAEIAREIGALTVAITTKPFRFEGRQRMNRAEDGIETLKDKVDTLITIPNERLLSIVNPSTTMMEAFSIADSILLQATRGISDLINNTGEINLDFADVRAIMENMGEAMMGTGVATGEERATLAAQMAISSPLLEEVSIKGAKGVLINITASSDLALHEVSEATDIIYKEVGDEANIILGSVRDDKMDDEIHVTVIATGFQQPKKSVGGFSPSFKSSPKAPDLVKATPLEIPAVQRETEFSESPSSNQSNEPMLTFGDDTETPAIIRMG